jgi:hypothetical protein
LLGHFILLQAKDLAICLHSSSYHDINVMIQRRNETQTGKGPPSALRYRV